MFTITRHNTVDGGHPSAFDQRPVRKLSALTLDRLADAELQHGHIARAEHLAHLAAEMRGRP